MNTFWVQVDIKLEGLAGRFYMNDHGGQDPVVAAIDKVGWNGHERPLPEVIAKLCRGWKPVFVDVGAGSGFFSLVAAAAGASRVFVCEADPQTRELLLSNLTESALTAKVSVSADAHATFLDQLFAQEETTFVGQQVLMRVDAKSLRTYAENSGLETMGEHRPTLVMEVLPGAEVAFLDVFCSTQKYDHIWLKPEQAFDITEGGIQASFTHRHHLLIPQEKTGKM